MTLQHCSETLWERGRLRGLNSKRNYIQLVHDWYQIRTFKQRLNFCVLWYRTYSLVYSFGPVEFRFDFSPIKDVHLLRVKAIFTNYCVKNKTWVHNIPWNVIYSVILHCFARALKLYHCLCLLENHKMLNFDIQDNVKHRIWITAKTMNKSQPSDK